jgi:hypothetical protein
MGACSRALLGRLDSSSSGNEAGWISSVSVIPGIPAPIKVSEEKSPGNSQAQLQATHAHHRGLSKQHDLSLLTRFQAGSDDRDLEPPQTALLTQRAVFYLRRLSPWQCALVARP